MYFFLYLKKWNSTGSKQVDCKKKFLSLGCFNVEKDKTVYLTFDDGPIRNHSWVLKN
jgi:peptidoglycan/xylan/chitin deacetylase (PgdA/CDA1 family)